MQRIICNKVYNTETAAIIKKVTFSYFGDPNGYEETLYQTEGGFFFLYTNGGESSKYTKEKIKRISAVKADAWLKEHN